MDQVGCGPRPRDRLVRFVSDQADRRRPLTTHGVVAKWPNRRASTRADEA